LQLETTFVVELICICKKVNEAFPCVLQQALSTNNRRTDGQRDASVRLFVSLSAVSVRGMRPIGGTNRDAS